MSPQHVRGQALALALLMVLPLAGANHDPLAVHKPDLFPTSALAQGTNELSPTKLCFDVFNAAPPGQGVAGLFEVFLRIDRVVNGTPFLHKELYARSSQPLAGGDRVAFCWDVELGAGRYRSYTAADIGGEVDEENEGNNGPSGGTFFEVAPRPRANLVIPASGLAVTPLEGRDDRAQYFRIRVLNLGDVPSVATTLLVRDETGILGQRDVPALPRGGLHEVVLETHPSQRPSGEFNLVATVDPDDLVDESNESDNVQRRTYRIQPHPLPDLAVGNLTLNGTLLERRALRLEAEVMNLGNKSAGTSVFQLQVNGVAIANHTLDRLNAGARALVEFPFYLLSGSHSVRVVADPDLLLVELDESNNANETILSVDELPADLRRPNLVVDRLSALPDDPGPGEAVTLNAYIRNIGERPSDNATVAFYAGGALVGEARVPPIQPDRYHSARINWTEFTEGPHTIRAFVDASAVLDEIHEDDNNETIFITILPPRVHAPPPVNDSAGLPPTETPPANVTPPASNPDARPPTTNATDLAPALEITQMSITTRPIPGALKGEVAVALRNPRIETVGRLTLAFKVDNRTLKEILVDGIPAAGVTGATSGELDLPAGSHTLTVDVRLLGNETVQATSSRTYSAEAGEKGIPGLPMWALVAAAFALALRRGRDKPRP